MTINQYVYLRVAQCIAIIAMIIGMTVGCDDESRARVGVHNAEHDQLATRDMNVEIDLTVSLSDTGTSPVDLGVEVRDSGEEPDSAKRGERSLQHLSAH